MPFAAALRASDLFCFQALKPICDLGEIHKFNCMVQSFGLLAPYLYIATELEALNIGIFMNSIMQIYQHWLVSQLRMDLRLSLFLPRSAYFLTKFSKLDCVTAWVQDFVQ